MIALDPQLAARIDAQIVRSPYGELLGLELVGLAEGHAQVRMPFRPAVTTVGDTVHGGAIAALVDTAGTASVWASASVSAQRGATVGFSLNFLAPARSSALVATATVRRRGGQLSTSEVTVRDEAGNDVAVALLTYKLS